MSTEIDELKQARYRSDKTISGHNAFLRPPTGETNSVDTRGFYFVLKEPHPNHFPDIVEQAGHETDIFVFDMGSLCNQGRCRRRREGMFAQLCAIFSALSDRSANEYAQGELLEHVHADHNHRLPDRCNLGAMSIVGGICKAQDPR